MLAVALKPSRLRTNFFQSLFYGTICARGFAGFKEFFNFFGFFFGVEIIHGTNNSGDHAQARGITL